MVAQTPRQLLVVVAATVAVLLVSALHATPGETAPATRVTAVDATPPTVSREAGGCYGNGFQHCSVNEQCCDGDCQYVYDPKRRWWWVSSQCVPKQKRR